MLQCLIQAGAGLDAGTIRILREAVKVGDVQEVRSLIQAGADKNALDRFGRTLLLVAAYDGGLEVQRFLVEAGAETEAVASIEQFN